MQESFATMQAHPKMAKGPDATGTSPSHPHNDRAVIEQALEVIHADWRRVAARLVPESVATVGIAQLRDGPAGRDLSRLAAVARGELPAEPEHVDQAVDSILQLLYWPAGAHTYEVPDGFWQTALGGVLARARATSRSTAERSPDWSRGTGETAPDTALPLAHPLMAAAERPDGVAR